MFAVIYLENNIFIDHKHTAIHFDKTKRDNVTVSIQKYINYISYF